MRAFDREYGQVEEEEQEEEEEDLDFDALDRMSYYPTMKVQGGKKKTKEEQPLVGAGSPAAEDDDAARLRYAQKATTEWDGEGAIDQKELSELLMGFTSNNNENNAELSYDDDDDLAYRDRCDPDGEAEGVKGFALEGEHSSHSSR